MSERTKHIFEFSAKKIAEAASGEAAYHADRADFWMAEYTKAVAILKKTAKVEFRHYAVTGGERVDLAVDYGDVASYSRMQEAWGKIQSHRQAAERFRMDAVTYGSQGERPYTLDASDVLYYRLGGGSRED